MEPAFTRWTPWGCAPPLPRRAVGEAERVPVRPSGPDVGGRRATLPSSTQRDTISGSGPRRERPSGGRPQRARPALNE